MGHFVCLISGCSNIDDTHQSWFRYLLPRCQMLRLIYSLIVQCFNVYLARDDDDNTAMAEFVLMICFYCTTIAKFAPLFLNRSRIAAILNELEANVEKQIERGGPQLAYLENANRFCDFISRRVQRFCLVIWTALTTVGFFSSLQTRTLDFR